MNYSEHISDIFRSIESDLGTRDLTSLVIRALKDCVEIFEAKDGEEFIKQLNGLIEVVKGTRPRIAIIIEHFYALWQRLSQLTDVEKHNLDICRKVVLEEIAIREAQTKEEGKNLYKRGLNIVKNNDVILIHNLSHTVLDILRGAKKSGKKFKIIVAQQEIDKTHAIVEFLHEYKISFQVIPEYMLSHIEEEINKVFLGGLTLNNLYNFVVDAGTMSVVSEFHLANKPIYMFIATSKFSMWEATQTHHTYKVTSQKTHCRRGIDFEHIKFSHDRVPLKLFDKIVTENGIFTNEEIKKMFDDKYKQRDEWRKKFFS